VEKGYGGAALEVAQKLRSHFDFETTNIYIQIPQEKLDELTEQLFNRRHFGYIHNTFLDVLYGPEDNRSSRTKEISALSSIFSVYETEATAGFIMKILAEKETVMKMIIRMGTEEAREYLFKINANLLTSKESDVQCFVTETECIRPKLKYCRGCAYSIPNFYTISAMIKSISDLLQNFSNAFTAAKGKAEKTKSANLLFKEIDLLGEACDTFGIEDVLSFFKGGEEGYNLLLESVNQVAAITHEDVESYLTYRSGGKEDGPLNTGT